MTWVKICGLTRPEDVEAAGEAGADALGFLLIETSPRFINIDQAADLIKRTELPAFILTKDCPPEDLIATALAAGASGIQPYGLYADEAARAATGVGLMVLRPTDPGGDLDRIPSEQYPLFDSKSTAGAGEGGVPLVLEAVPVTRRDFVLAGGLTPTSVAGVVARRHPWGVDVSSGVETRPGVKDQAAMKAFVAAARTA